MSVKTNRMLVSVRVPLLGLGVSLKAEDPVVSVRPKGPRAAGVSQDHGLGGGGEGRVGGSGGLGGRPGGGGWGDTLDRSN
jgi:hypothetical protein